MSRRISIYDVPHLVISSRESRSPDRQFYSPVCEKNFLFAPPRIREAKCPGQAGIALVINLPRPFLQVPLCDGGLLVTNGAVLAEDLQFASRAGFECGFQRSLTGLEDFESAAPVGEAGGFSAISLGGRTLAQGKRRSNALGDKSENPTRVPPGKSRLVARKKCRV